MENLPIAALITAAGLSSRMGRLKALLPFGEGSMISTCVDNMRLGGAEEILVITGYKGEEIESHLGGKGCRFIRNPNFRENQMFDSLTMGLRQLEGHCRAVIVSPVDVPAVKPETIMLLTESEGDFIVPVYKGKWGHPVIIRGDVIPSILSHSGEGGLRGAIEALGIAVKTLECEDEGVSIDADRPEDYERLLRLGERK